jgi:LysM repeat protein
MDDVDLNTLAPPASTGIHFVTFGDTLWSIAADYLGDPNLWPEIHKLNPWIENPDRIFPGQEIQLPDAANDAELEAVADEVVLDDNALFDGGGAAAVALAGLTRFGAKDHMKTAGMFSFDSRSGKMKPSYGNRSERKIKWN